MSLESTSLISSKSSVMILMSSRFFLRIWFRISSPRRPRFLFSTSELSAIFCNSSSTKTGTTIGPSKNPVWKISATRPSMMIFVSSSLPMLCFSFDFFFSLFSSACSLNQPVISAFLLTARCIPRYPSTMDSTTETYGPMNGTELKASPTKFAMMSPRKSPSVPAMRSCVLMADSDFSIRDVNAKRREIR